MSRPTLHPLRPFVVLLPLLAAGAAAASVPITAPLRISVGDEGGVEALDASVAALSDDTYLIVWTDGGNFSNFTLYARKMGIDAQPITPVVPVGTSRVFGAIDSPAVASDAAGDAVLVWLEDSSRLVGRTVSADLSDVSPVFEIAQSGVDIEQLSVARAPEGEFIVGYQTHAYFGDINAFARLFAPDGTPLGPADTLNFPFADGSVDVGAAANGDFVVKWQIDDLNQAWVVSDGVPGSPFDLREPGFTGKIDVAANGDFVFVAKADLQLTAQRFSATGAPIGEEILVADLGDVFTDLDVLVRDDGSFVVTWTDISAIAGQPPTNDATVRAREYDAEGVALGGAFRVSEPDPRLNSAFEPTISVVGDDFVIGWRAVEFPFEDKEIFVRSFTPQPTDLELAVRGECPGAVTVEVANATPASEVGFVSSRNLGSTTVVEGECAGMTLELDDGRPTAQRIETDGIGAASVTFEIPEQNCGVHLQAVELGRCATSPVVATP